MDKKTAIIVGAICAVVVVLLCIVFVMDSKIEDTPSDVLVTINDQQYTIEEYKKYETLTNFEAGESDKKMDEEALSEMVTNFVKHKLYYQAALKNEVSGEADINYEEEYDSKSGELTAIGITKEDYKSLKEEEAKVTQLENHIYEYYQIPEEAYDEYVAHAKENNIYYTYTFRIMQIPFEEPEESGEKYEAESATSGEENTVEADVSGEEKKDMSREAQKLVAEEVVQKIRSGEDFEKLSEEYGQMRIAFAKTGYTILNGGIEYATGAVLESKLGGFEDVYNAFLQLEEGECTEPIEIPGYNLFQITKLETKEDGFVGDADEELRISLLSQIEEELVYGDSHVHYNQGAYYRIAY